jgi:hypothetical protein
MGEKPASVLKPDFRSTQNDLHEIESGLFLGKNCQKIVNYTLSIFS